MAVKANVIIPGSIRKPPGGADAGADGLPQRWDDAYKVHPKPG
jgi:hypothetical protein